MKRGTLPNMAQPTIRILLVGPHTYQISFRNIYGYLKTILLDRCKKVGAQYLYYEKSYLIQSQKLADLKKEFEDVLNMKTNDNKMKFKIEDFPMTNIKMILKSDKKNEGKDRNKNRIIFIDKSSLNRYFYLRKRIEDTYCETKKSGDNKKQRRISLIVTSEMNRKFWLSNILQPKKISGQQQKGPIMSNLQFPLITELTYSQLSSKKLSNYQSNHNSYSQLNKIYLITYDNLKFVQNSWILAQIQMVSILLVDDAEFLVTGECQLSTLQNKKRNFEAFRLLVKNYPIDQQLLLFFSKLPQPVDLYKLLVLTKPKNFSGIKFSTTLNSCIFNESLFTPQQKCMYDEFTSWFRKRYRNDNKNFKEIFYLLKNVVVKTLDETVFKRTPDLLSSLELNPKIFQQNIKITLLESTSDIVQKFRIMDRKYKKGCPSINLKQILEDFHDTLKSSERKFQVTSKIDDHIVNKSSKNYFFEAKQLMLNSKFQMILRRLYFVINSQKERICIVIEDQKLQKRLKKYLKETQVQYIDYELPKGNKQIYKNNFDTFQNQPKNVTYSQFDSNSTIKACIININRVHRQYLQLIKMYKNILKKENQFEFNYGCSQSNRVQEILIPKLTTPESVHFIDIFWNQFNFEKEKFLHSIFQFQISYIQQSHKDGKVSFKEIYKPNKVTQNYFLFDGSHEKVMLQKYLLRKQSIQKIKIQENQSNQENLDQFVNNILLDENIKFSKCEIIDYLDIDEEFDKIEEQAKKMKNNKIIDPKEQKVFLPKYTKPDCKSFKEMLQQKLLQKNIDDILEGSQEFYDYEKRNDLILEKNKEEVLKLVQQKQKQQNIKLQNQQQQVCQNNKCEEDFINKKQQQPNKQLQLSNIFSQFLIETAHQQPNPITKQPSVIGSNILPNQQQKDLFDQLLGNDFQLQNFKQQTSIKKQTKFQQVQTQSEYDEDKYLIEPKNWTNKQQQQPPKDQLLLNFGYLAYHNLEKQDLKTRSSNLPNNSSKLTSVQKKDDSIEIIETTPLIKRTHSQKLKNNRIPNRIRPSQYISNKFNTKSQKLPYYQLPKQKRLCNKKLYEQAISKSKQLWEKKLRKQKELLILKSTNLQIDLKPKQGWKHNLTSQEIKQLKMKGIQI